MISMLTSLIVVFGAMALIGCCVIPYIQGLILRLIETALTKQTPVSYQLLLIKLSEFEEKNRK
jgi:fucose permease